MQKVILTIAPIFLTLALLFSAPGGIGAATVDELRQRLEEQNAKIQQIQKEIEQYQKELEKVGAEKQSLQNAIKTLDIARNKLSSDIRLTEGKIAARSTEIDQLSLDIVDKEDRIHESNTGLAATIRSIAQVDEQSTLELVLSRPSLSDVWVEYDTTAQFQTAVATHVDALAQLKSELEDRRALSLQKKRELEGLRFELTGEKKALDANRSSKNELLAVTKSKESEYQKTLEEKKRLHQQFEREMLEIEAELKLAIDPASIPETRKGVLIWPLDKVRITQYFGNTAFATQNPQIYGGKGHNGIDLAASLGTRIKAARQGVVKGTGDTDRVCPNASYGKWVFIEHDNGLSTLYAHLSSINVSGGQAVETGAVIGYSGNTGYSTGPHLHFTVYASQGVRIRTFPSSVCRGAYTIPIADFKAYLNPLSYLGN